MRLIDADALLEKLEKTCRYFTVKFDIEEQPTADVCRWIPVGEKLPEIGETVLVIASGWPKLRKELRGAVEIATLYADRPQPDWMLEAWPDWACPEVTHWMPLPEPPENLMKED